MNYWFFLKCFLIGIISSSVFGPVFILTFNRGALFGFTKGFATALGAALVDGIFFTAGLMGALPLLQSSRYLLLSMGIIGSIVLLLFGFKLLHEDINLDRTAVTNESILKCMTKSFLMTIVNPFIALFFTFISVQLLPDETIRFSFTETMLGGSMVTAGSLSVLSIVALVASYAEHVINRKKLHYISYVSGLLFLGGGFYLFLKTIIAFYWS